MNGYVTQWLIANKWPQWLTDSFSIFQILHQQHSSLHLVSHVNATYSKLNFFCSSVFFCVFVFNAIFTAVYFHGLKNRTKQEQCTVCLFGHFFHKLHFLAKLQKKISCEKVN